MSSAPTTPKLQTISIKSSRPPLLGSPLVSAISADNENITLNDIKSSTTIHLHHKAYSDGNNTKSSCSSSSASSSSSCTKRTKTKTKTKAKANTRTKKSKHKKSNRKSKSPSHNKSKSLTPKRSPINPDDLTRNRNMSINISSIDQDDDDEKTPPNRPSLNKQRGSKSNPRRRNRPKMKKKGSKSVAFALDDTDHLNEGDNIADLPNVSLPTASLPNAISAQTISTSVGKRKKAKVKKRKSITQGQTIHKQLEKHLISVNQYLLPAPKKHGYFKWYISVLYIKILCEFADRCFPER